MLMERLELAGPQTQRRELYGTMDAKFHPAIAAIKSGDVDRLRALVSEDPTLATSRSSTSHPTLLQCLVLRGRAKISSHL